MSNGYWWEISERSQKWAQADVHYSLLDSKAGLCLLKRQDRKMTLLKGFAATSSRGIQQTSYLNPLRTCFSFVRSSAIPTAGSLPLYRKDDQTHNYTFSSALTANHFQALSVYYFNFLKTFEIEGFIFISVLQMKKLKHR